MEEPKVKIIEYKCPSCGSDRRLGKYLSNKVKAKGWMREDLNYYLHEMSAVVSDPQKEMIKPIGSTSLMFRAYMDICFDCGCFYAAKIELHTVTKSLPPAPPGVGLGPFSKD